jgi:hypothetical protein
MTPSRTLAAVAVLLLAAPGCRRSAGPAESYRAFAAAARAGDVEGVWARVATRSRGVLEARARELATRSSGVVPSSGKELVLGDLAAAAPRIRAVTVLRESRDAAVVAVEEEGRTGAREVSLVREDGVWRVVLPFDN